MKTETQIFHSRSAKETALIAEAIAKCLKGNEVIALSGELGAGKTTLVRALARALGIQETVRSPSFALIHEYALPNGQRFFHADLYRLTSSDQVIGIGLEELIGEGILVIEWPERASEILPQDCLSIRIELNPDESRSLYIYDPCSILQVTKPDSTLG